MTTNSKSASTSNYARFIRKGHYLGDNKTQLTLSMCCWRLLYNSSRAMWLLVSWVQYFSFFSWHYWVIKISLMHHIYSLFITGRICPDQPRIFLRQLFSQRLFQSILEFNVFSFHLFHLNKDKAGGGNPLMISKHSSHLVGILLMALLDKIRRMPQLRGTGKRYRLVKRQLCHD